MNTPASSGFRGTRALEEVIERMKPLADWLQAFRPDCRTMTVSRRDLDIVQRYAQAADVLYQIVTNNGATYWRGFELRPEPVPKITRPAIRP